MKAGVGRVAGLNGPAAHEQSPVVMPVTRQAMGLKDGPLFIQGHAQCQHMPGGWDNNLWTAAPTPSGHAQLNLNNGNVNDNPDANNNNVTAVL